MLGLFISKISCAGFSLLPDMAIKGMLYCSSILLTEDSDEFEPSDDRVIDPKIYSKPVYTNGNRIFVVHGLRFIQCVCEVLPVESRNLETIKEDCCFATDELNELFNSHKRSMLCWWYPTNIFSIAAKGNVEKCLNV